MAIDKRTVKLIRNMERIATILGEYPDTFRSIDAIWDDVPGRTTFGEMKEALHRLVVSGIVEIERDSGYRLRRYDNVLLPPAIEPYRSSLDRQ